MSNNYKTIEKKQIENNGKEYEIIKFNKNNIKYVHLEQSAFNMYMEEQKEKKENIISAPGCCNPDDCYVDDKNKKIFIIEKKFQQTSGSVEEKIQTGIFKKYHYEELYPNYEINYIYCLSTWFKNEKNSSVIKYLNNNNIPVFFNDKPNNEKSIVNYINKKSNEPKKIKNDEKKINNDEKKINNDEKKINDDEKKKNDDENEIDTDDDEKINMNDIFSDELPIRHVIKKNGKKIKSGEYDKNKNKIISNNEEFSSLSNFAYSHYRDTKSDIKTANGWIECEIYIDGKWKIADELRTKKKINKALKSNTNEKIYTSDNDEDSNSDKSSNKKIKKSVKKNKSIMNKTK